jgi:hypothetical protein
MQSSNYPDIHIRSKNELAKRIVGTGISKAIALDLINDVLEHHDEYWRDNVKRSEPTIYKEG